MVADWKTALQEEREAKDDYFGSNPHSPIPPEDSASFDGLAYYPPDEAYRFELPLHEHEDKATVTVGTSTGGEQDYLRWGAFRFAVDGETVTLQAYKADPQDDRLWVPFRDETSGEQTYGYGPVPRSRTREPPDGRRRVDSRLQRGVQSDLCVLRQLRVPASADGELARRSHRSRRKSLRVKRPVPVHLRARWVRRAVVAPRPARSAIAGAAGGRGRVSRANTRSFAERGSSGGFPNGCSAPSESVVPGLWGAGNPIQRTRNGSRRATRSGPRSRAPRRRARPGRSPGGRRRSPATPSRRRLRSRGPRSRPTL
jgi:hypothetical protein